MHFFSDDNSHFIGFSNPDQKHEVAIMQTIARDNNARENKSTHLIS